jgi:hypothetical protein
MYFAWGAEWMPVAPRLNGELISRINEAITQALREEPGRGGEIGGILLGTVEFRPQAPAIVRIESFELLESEHRRGPSFILSERDKRTLGKRLHWWSTQRKSDLRPVGYFRTHTRRGLYLDNDDYGVAQAYFPEPHSVFLLIHPAPGTISTAGFFFWQDGDMHRESTLAEFPFHVSRLALRPEPPLAAPGTAAFRRTPAPVPAPQRPIVDVLPKKLAAPATSPAALSQPAAASVLPSTAPPSLLSRDGFLYRNRAALAILPAAVLLFSVTFYAARRQMRHNPENAQLAPVVNTARLHSTPAEFEKPSPLQPPGESSGLDQLAKLPAQGDNAAELNSNEMRKQGRAPDRSKAGGAAREDEDESEPQKAETIIYPAPEPVKPPAAPPEPPPAQSASANVPAPPPVVIPERTEIVPPRRPPAIVTVEPAPGGKFGRFLGRIGIRRHNQQKQGFVPARAIRQITPSVPPSLELDRDVSVDLKVTVDPAGSVSNVTTARGADKRLMSLAANAVREWKFEPAHVDEDAVESELLLHFTFRGSKQTQP